MTDKKRTKLEKKIVFFPPLPRKLSFCLSVSQLYPLFALHAEDQSNGFQEAAVEITDNRDVMCPSVSKILHISIAERRKIVLQEG